MKTPFSLEIVKSGGPAHSSHPSRTVRAGHVSGNVVHDAQIATLPIIKGLIIKWTLFRKSPLAPLFQRGVLFLPLAKGG